MKKILASIGALMLVMTLAVMMPAAVTNADDNGLTVTKELVSYTDENENGLIEVGEETSFVLTITVTNKTDSTIGDVVVKDRLGGDLELDECDAEVTTDTKGRTEKVFLSWEVGTLEPWESASLTCTVSTDINPGGNQEYTETGCHYLNSGANAKGRLEGKQVSATSDPICIVVTEAELSLCEKDPNTWACVTDGASGLMGYNLAGPTFDFMFLGSGLEVNTDYSLIYYADFEDRFNFWGGNNPGALIGTGTSDGNGNLSMSDCVDLGMALPHPDDANAYYHHYSGDPDYYLHDQGAKIWLVPSDCYDADAKKVTIWSPGRFLFETDLITYDDTDI
jgi:hypothetical protein